MTGGKAMRQRGDYFERQAKAALEARGWRVIRAAGSLGEADLWAARHDRTLMLVSCKLSGRISPGERLDLLELARQTGGRAVVAMRPRAGRVMFAAVIDGTHHLVPIDTLPVPPPKDRRVRPPRPATPPPEAVPDGLAPAGVQLTLPHD